MGITFSTRGAEPAPGDADVVLLLPAVDVAVGVHVSVSRHAAWAQTIGEVLPLTHFLRIVRGILLKGNGLDDVFLHLWQIALFAAIALTIGVKRYRQTLD